MTSLTCLKEKINVKKNNRVLSIFSNSADYTTM